MAEMISGIRGLTMTKEQKVTRKKVKAGYSRLSKVVTASEYFRG